jgi:putative ABC transport system permease protein
VPTEQQEIESNRIQTRWLLCLALLVAFVGILNAMLMSVTERFREIGTMKCLGALDSFIIKLFLLESLFQGIVGTLIGVVIGLGLSVLAAASNYGSYAWNNFPKGQIGESFLICLLVGIGLTVAGAVYPAWQAARMQPIEAMRVET